MHLIENEKVVEFENKVQKTTPVVSVIVLTFNQLNYIKETLESIISQKIDFDFEIIIGDDDSTDGTRELCIAYAKKYPKLIKLFLHSEKNKIYISGKKTGRFNFLYNYHKARGKYIALCEGDDYWTDPLKLQKQVDFLEANPEYGLCFHRVKLLMPDGNFKEDHLTKVPEKYENIENLALHGNYIHTPSVVFKPEGLVFPKQIEQTPIGDFFLHMLVARNRKIGYLNEEMAVYRFGVGMWSEKSEYERNFKTALTFALLIDTKLFSKEVNAILLSRIKSFINRYHAQLQTAHSAQLGFNKEIRNALAQARVQQHKTNLYNRLKPLYGSLKNFLKVKHKTR